MFSGNTALLVASPTLQDYLVDKLTGLPLAAGVVTFYQDSQRQILKNVYYQQGAPGAYTYTALPNPLTLSSVGTIVDNNGNDTIPFFYPVSETDNSTAQPYYVTVYSSNAVLQFTRQNFPFVPVEPIGTGNPVISNYLTNNLFWRNSGGISLNGGTVTFLAPGNHDGFVSGSVSPNSVGPDILFVKNKTGATESVTYPLFTSGTLLPNDITPEYYANFSCSAPTTGETVKCVQFPIQLHINSLQNAQMICSFWAKSNSSDVNTITVYLYQYQGTGASIQPARILQGTGSFTLNSTWTPYQVPIVFPLKTLSLGGAGDDGWFLQFDFPHNAAYNINFCKPCLYLGSTLPSAQYSSYDQIDSIIGTPRTGDSRSSYNAFAPYGWVACNDGTIGSAGSGGTARANIDTWPLYNLLYNAVTIPSSNARCIVTGYTGNAYNDFIANAPMNLPYTLGRALASVGTPSSGTNTGTNWPLGQKTGNEEATLSVAQIPTHTHDPPGTTQFVVGNIAGSLFISTAPTNGEVETKTGGITGYTSQSPLVMQPPTTYLNVFLKL